MEVWADSQRLAAGDLLTASVMGASDRCEHFLAVVSTNAINSPWVAKEIKYAIERTKRVIPVLLPPIEPSALPLWFAEEPVGLKLSIGLARRLSAALPDLLAALGLRQPTEKLVALQRAPRNPLAAPAPIPGCPTRSRSAAPREPAPQAARQCSHPLPRERGNSVQSFHENLLS